MAHFLEIETNGIKIIERTGVTSGWKVIEDTYKHLIVKRKGEVRKYEVRDQIDYMQMRCTLINTQRVE